MKVRLLVSLLPLVFALALSACGGGDSEGSASADSGQGAGAEPASASIPPEVKEAVSKGLETGAYATEAAEVRALEVSGDQATAEVKLLGGTLGEQTVEAVLVREGKGWKLKELTKFVQFDKPTLVRAYETETKGLPEEFAPKVVRCLTRAFSGSSEAEIEAMYLDQDKDLFLALGKRCLNN